MFPDSMPRHALHVSPSMLAEVLVEADQLKETLKVQNEFSKKQGEIVAQEHREKFLSFTFG